jgi:hypothetical protein
MHEIKGGVAYRPNHLGTLLFAIAQVTAPSSEASFSAYQLEAGSDRCARIGNDKRPSAMNGCAPEFSAIRKQSRRLAEDRVGIGKPMVQTQVVGPRRRAWPTL